MAKSSRNVEAPLQSRPRAHRNPQHFWKPLTDILNRSSRTNTSNMSSRPVKAPSSRLAQPSTGSQLRRDASEDEPAKRHHRAKGRKHGHTTSNADIPSKKTNVGLGVPNAPPPLPHRKWAARKERDTYAAPKDTISATSSKRAREDVEAEEDTRSQKRKKTSRTAQVPEEASRAPTPSKSSKSAGEAQIPHGKGKSKKKVPWSNVKITNIPYYEAAGRYLAALSAAPSEDASGSKNVRIQDTHEASGSKTTELHASSSSRPVSPSFVDSSFESEVATKTKSKKTPRLGKEVHVLEGSKRRVYKSRHSKSNDGGDDSSGHKRKQAKSRKGKEKVVDAWTVMGVSPTPSPTKNVGENTDEEEVDELFSSPVKLKPVDYSDPAEDTDDDGGGSLFTPPRKGKGRHVNKSMAFVDEDIVDFPHSHAAATSVTRSPSPIASTSSNAKTFFVTSSPSFRSPQARDNADVVMNEVPGSVSSKLKKPLEKSAEAAKELRTRIPSKPMSPPANVTPPKAEPTTPTVTKHKRSQDDPSSSSKKPKLESSSPKQWRVNTLGEEERRLKDDERNAILFWARKHQEILPRLTNHGQRQRQGAPRRADSVKEEEDLVAELSAMRREFNEDVASLNRRREEIRRKQQEEKERTEAARQKKERARQVRLLRERRKDYRKKWGAWRDVRVKTEVGVTKKKSKSRLGEMLKSEKERENGRIRRANPRKVIVKMKIRRGGSV